MKNQDSSRIDAWFPAGEAPHLNEHASRVVALNSTSTASVERCYDMLYRALIFTAAAIQDCPEGIVHARDLYLPDEYETFNHREKCLNGMTLAFLCRKRRVPLERLPYASSPAQYQIVPDLINFDLVHSLTH